MVEVRRGYGSEAEARDVVKAKFVGIKILGSDGGGASDNARLHHRVTGRPEEGVSWSFYVTLQVPELPYLLPAGRSKGRGPMGTFGIDDCLRREVRPCLSFWPLYADGGPVR